MPEKYEIIPATDVDNTKHLVTNILIRKPKMDGEEVAEPGVKAEVKWDRFNTDDASIEDLEEFAQERYGCSLQVVLDAAIRQFMTRPNYSTTVKEGLKAGKSNEEIAADLQVDADAYQATGRKPAAKKAPSESAALAVLAQKKGMSVDELKELLGL